MAPVRSPADGSFDAFNRRLQHKYLGLDWTSTPIRARSYSSHNIPSSRYSHAVYEKIRKS